MNDPDGLLIQRWTHVLSYDELIRSLAIGLFQLWRFQYLFYETEHVFFLSFYILFHIFIGYPFLYMELALGSIRRRFLCRVWDIAPIGQGIKYTWLLISLQKAIICVIIGGYTIALSVSIFNNDDGRLPFLLCRTNTTDSICGNITSRALYKHFSSPTQYYASNFTPNGFTPIYVLLIGITIIWIIVYLIVRHGVYSYSKMIVFNSIMVFCFVLLFTIVALQLHRPWELFTRSDFNNTNSSRRPERSYTPVLTNKHTNKITVSANKFDSAGIKMIVHSTVQAAKQVLSELAIGSGPVVLLGVHNIELRSIMKASITCCLLSVLISMTTCYQLYSVTTRLVYENPTYSLQPGPRIFFILWAELTMRMCGSHFWLFVVCTTLVCVAAATAALYFIVVVQIVGKCESSLPVLTPILILIGYFLTAVAVITEPFENTYVVGILDTWSTSTCILIVTTFTALVLSFSHGQTLFCDDVRHAINEYPNTFVRICWTVVPFILILFFILDCVYIEETSALSNINNIIGFILIGITLSPIMVTALRSRKNV